jgi:uncharacterized protein
LEALKQDIAARVRGSTIGDTRVRDLIAELLWFHQRSQKPGWWAVFERESWIRTKKSLRIARVSRSRPRHNRAAGHRKRSADYTYNFLVQDTKLRAGNKPKLPTTRADVGTIMAVDPEEGRIVIRRGLAGGPPPNVMNLISAPMNMRDVPLGVMTFAERFAAGETANDGALLDFLMRAPPRLKGVASGAALQTRERMQRRLLCAPSPLSTIAISSFKDRLAPARYTAAEAIILSLKQGYRIGVASNSHKAIRMLLEEVEIGIARQVQVCGRQTGKQGRRGKALYKQQYPNCVGIRADRNILPPRRRDSLPLLPRGSAGDL